MRLPVLRGTIKRRLLVNFRADPDPVANFLPAPLRPKLHAGQAIVGICLIRLEAIRPAGLPALLGLSSENSAHRIAVEWEDEHGRLREGVFIPRRDTGSRLNHLAGGRLFPGEHHLARFDVHEDERGISLRMHSDDGSTSLRVEAKYASVFPGDSIFASLEESSRFFEAGATGFSVTRDPARLDGLRLQTKSWQVEPLAVNHAEASLFQRGGALAAADAQFDHALLMRNIPHEWHQEPDLRIGAGCQPALA